MGHAFQFAVTSDREVTRIDGTLEEHFVERIVSTLRRGDVFWDVGANIGIVTLIAHRRIDGLKVHCFEPEARTVTSLEANLKLNGLTDAKVYALALADRTGTASFHVSGEAGEGTNSLVPRAESPDGVVEVRVERADELVQRGDAPAPAVVKIDVEGAEVQVLAGMEQLLADSVRHLLIEMHPVQLQKQGWSPERLSDWLAARDFKSVWRDTRDDEIHEHFQRL